MKLYSCKILLAGSNNNQVRKDNVTAAEIIMLRHIHGGDENVTDIREMKNVKAKTVTQVVDEDGEVTTLERDRTQRDERDRLATEYAVEVFTIDGTVPASGRKRVNDVFGVGTELPTYLDEVELRNIDVVDPAPRRKEKPLTLESMGA
jgi:hypothetical protein